MRSHDPRSRESPRNQISPIPAPQGISSKRLPGTPVPVSNNTIKPSARSAAVSNLWLSVIATSRSAVTALAPIAKAMMTSRTRPTHRNTSPAKSRNKTSQSLSQSEPSIIIGGPSSPLEFKLAPLSSMPPRRTVRVGPPLSPLDQPTNDPAVYERSLKFLRFPNS
jgi:hypothetical protein